VISDGRARDQMVKARDELREEQVMRKKLRNELEDLKGKIRVYCRCRPMNKREIELAVGECVRFPDPFTITVRTRTMSALGALDADCVPW
jgi:hypothetical protein